MPLVIGLSVFLQFACLVCAACKSTLDAVIAANPQFQSTDGHMMYARCPEGLGDVDAALKEFAILAESFPGEEGRGRYALLLKRNGQLEQAGRIFKVTLARAKVAPRYYCGENREWIELAREQLARDLNPP